MFEENFRIVENIIDRIEIGEGQVDDDLACYQPVSATPPGRFRLHAYRIMVVTFSRASLEDEGCNVL